MSDLTSSMFSRSTTNTSKNKKNSINSSHFHFITKEFVENEKPKEEYEDYILVKKEKNLNLNKLEILKNRINNLKQQENKNIQQIKSLQEKEEKMKKIIKAKKENKKMIDDLKKKELDKFLLIKKKIQEDRQTQINNLNNTLLRRKEMLNQKAKMVKQTKNEIKNKINKNNYSTLNKNKIKYEKSKTSHVFTKDKNIIAKAEKEEQKRRDRKEIINKEKLENLCLEKNIELLIQEEEKYLNLIKKTQLIKQKLNDNLFSSTQFNKSFINKSNDIKETKCLNSINKSNYLRLKTEENFNNNKSIKSNNNLRLRTFHNSLDLDSINNYCDKKKIIMNKKKKNSINRKLINNIGAKSCSKKINKDEDLSVEEKNKERDKSNDICYNPKKGTLKQRILDKIINIKLESNLG